MRQLLKFVIELFVVACIVGWVVAKYPEMFDAFMPALVTIVLIHMAWEYVFQTGYLKQKRHELLDAKPASGWILCVAIAASVLVCCWFSSKQVLFGLENYHKAHKPPPSPLPNPDKPLIRIANLQELFMDQFVYERYVVLGLGLVEERKDHVMIPAKAIFDRYGNHYSIAFYIPSNKWNYQICASLSRVKYAEVFRKQLMQRGGMKADDADVDFDDGLFSGQVFIYNEDALTASQEAEITLAFASRRLTVQFRDQQYLGHYLMEHPQFGEVTKPR